MFLHNIYELCLEKENFRAIFFPWPHPFSPTLLRCLLLFDISQMQLRTSAFRP